jgi:elongation factor 1 alpha-like protein
MIGWDEKRYDYICDKVYPFLKQAGYAEKNIYFVPISGLSGDNLDSRDSQPE